MSERPISDDSRLLALFPGGLGDFLCCWAALDALRVASGMRLTLVARPAWLALLGDDDATPLSIDRREVADLFASAPLHRATLALFGSHARAESWTGHGDAAFARRLADASGGRVAVHPFRAMRPGEHAAHYYARCLAGPAPLTRLAVRPTAAQWAESLWQGNRLPARTLVVHAGSGGAPKVWSGASAVADAWRADGGAVVWIEGPAEIAPVPLPVDDVVIRGEPLDRIAAVLQRAERYVGNDSGISHLAGLIGARGAVVFGPSDAATWRPLGSSLTVLSAADICAACGPTRLCTHRMPVERVIAALR